MVTMCARNKGCITIIVVYLKWPYNHICYICDKGCLINRHQCDIDVMLVVRKSTLRVCLVRLKNELIVNSL